MKSFEIKIAAVVVTYNRAAELISTLKAILQEGIAERNIFVINNNSIDNTRQLLASQYPSINAFHLSDNIASAGGFEKGLKLAHEHGFDLVWLFNDDSRPISGALNTILSFLKQGENSKFGLLKIGNVNEKGKAVLLYWKGVRYPVYTEVSNRAVETDLVTFDGCMVSRSLMDAIGYCDPEYFMGTYEFDYCLRAKDAGFKIFTIPNGMIEDSKLGSKGGTPPWRQYYNTRNHLRLALHRRSFFIFKGWLVREIKYTFAILTSGDKKWERLSYKCRAVRDALMNKRGKVYLPG